MIGGRPALTVSHDKRAAPVAFAGSLPDDDVVDPLRSQALFVKPIFIFIPRPAALPLPLRRAAGVLCLCALALLIGACGGGSSASTDTAVVAAAPTLQPASISASNPVSSPPAPAPQPAPAPGPPPKASLLAGGLSSPWGLAFLPDGRMLVTQKSGSMVIVSSTGSAISAPFGPGLPNLTSSGQGGLLDVALDPDFNLTGNPRIYWAFSESGAGGSGTAVARGDLIANPANPAANAVQNAQVIYRQTPKVGGDGHFGARLVFRSDKTLLVTLGERQRDDPASPGSANAQNLASTLGKVIRINRDGSVPAGNPSFGVAGALPEIWSYGHRNPQGAAMKTGTDELWLTEHGPLGGDELNRVVPGGNYGWPLRSYGCPYSVGVNSVACRPGGGTHAPTYEEPKTYWLPISTAPSGLIFYSGSRFDDLGWPGNVFAGALAGTTLWRIVLSGDNVTLKEEVAAVKALGQRIRVVKQGPDGWIYLLTDSGQVIRLER